MQEEGNRERQQRRGYSKKAVVQNRDQGTLSSTEQVDLLVWTGKE